MSEVKEGLDIRNFRPFSKVATVQIEMEKSITVEGAVLRLDLLVTQVILRPIHVVEKDHSFGFEVI